MPSRLLVLAVLIFLLAGCQAGLLETSPGGPSPPELPDTWTLEPSQTPTQRPPSQAQDTAHGPTPGTTGTAPVPTASLVSPITPSPTRSRFHAATPMPLVPGMDFNLLQIEMFTAQQGWALGSQRDQYVWILSTGDGGRTWTDRTPALIFYDRGKTGLKDITVYFQDERTALTLFRTEVMGEDYGVHRVWRTTDGGQSWTPSEPLPFLIHLHDIEPREFFFLDEHIGWLRVNVRLFFSRIREDAFLFRTVNGGASWELVNAPQNGQIEARVNTAMAFANPSEGWMVKDSLGEGYFPFLELTRDGGSSWEWVSLPAPEGSWEDQDRRCIGLDPRFFEDGSGAFLLNCLSYSEEQEDYDPDQTISYLYRCTDFWKHWDIQELPAPVSQLVFLDGDLGYAMGREHYRTVDGGETWELIKTVGWEGQFSFISPDEAWAVALDPGQIALVHTVDGGETYQIIEAVLE